MLKKGKYWKFLLTHMDKKLELLLVEDDPADRKKMITEIENNVLDFVLVGSTGSSAEALQIVMNSRPDAVILDLELHQGEGDGLEFLQKLKKLGNEYRPFILVTTNNISNVTHTVARELGADFIMTKNQEGYSPKAVLDFLKITKGVIKDKSFFEDSKKLNQNRTQDVKRLQRIVCNELNNVGLSPKSLGYKYLIDAIITVMNEPVQHLCNVIGNKYGKSENSVERAMQNAINRAWNSMDVKELNKYYTAKIGSEKGVPTITEFIYFYAQKIDNEY